MQSEWTGRLRKGVAAGPIMAPGEQLGLKVGEQMKIFRSLEQLMMPFAGKKVRVTIEELPDEDLTSSTQELLAREGRNLEETPDGER